MGSIDFYTLSERFNVEVDYLKKYLDHLEQGINLHKSELNNYLDEDIANTGQHYSDSLLEVYKDDLIKIPSYSYNSGFLLIYSLLESSLLKLCTELELQLNLPISLKEIKGGNYFEASLKYIHIFTPLNTAIYEKGKDFVSYQKIRNRIVHNAATMDTICNEQRLFAKSITYDNSGSFYINNVKFLKLFLSKVESFIESCLQIIGSLEIIPVRTHTKGIIKYFSSDEYKKHYTLPVALEKNEFDLPF